MFEEKDIIARLQPKQLSNKYLWIRKELTPDSQEYLEVKATCPRGGYQAHFVELMKEILMRVGIRTNKDLNILIKLAQQ